MTTTDQEAMERENMFLQLHTCAKGMAECAHSLLSVTYKDVYVGHEDARRVLDMRNELIGIASKYMS